LATDLADLLVLRGVPFRQAHEIVGKLVRLAAEQGVGLDALSPDEYLGASSVLDAPSVRAIFDLQSAMAARKSVGAPAPENVAARLAHWQAHLSA
jgi:argininosuccinate lyase